MLLTALVGWLEREQRDEIVFLRGARRDSASGPADGDGESELGLRAHSGGMEDIERVAIFGKGFAELLMVGRREVMRTGNQTITGRAEVTSKLTIES